jgi:hypothetical protein
VAGVERVERVAGAAARELAEVEYECVLLECLLECLLLECVLLECLLECVLPSWQERVGKGEEEEEVGVEVVVEVVVETAEGVEVLLHVSTLLRLHPHIEIENSRVLPNVQQHSN